MNNNSPLSGGGSVVNAKAGTTLVRWKSKAYRSSEDEATELFSGFPYNAGFTMSYWTNKVNDTDPEMLYQSPEGVRVKISPGSSFYMVFIIKDLSFFQIFESFELPLGQIVEDSTNTNKVTFTPKENFQIIKVYDTTTSILLSTVINSQLASLTHYINTKNDESFTIPNNDPYEIIFFITNPIV